MNKNARIYVAGHRGMVGSAIVRCPVAAGYTSLVVRTRNELNLLAQRAVRAFIEETKQEYVFLAAARVGDIHANNTTHADFIYQDLVIETNVIEAAFRAGVRRLMFLGSSCIYPRDCPQPIREEYLLTGPRGATNEPYAIAKIAGIRLCEADNSQHRTQYVSVMPTSLCSPRDNYDLATSDVLPALIRKTHEARVRGERTLSVWGTGRPRREFVYVDDLADACVFLMEHDHSGDLLNTGTGEDVTIRELVETVMRCVGLDTELAFEAPEPDGSPRKLLDVSRMRSLGWGARIPLEAGIRPAYQDFLRPHSAPIST